MRTPDDGLRALIIRHLRTIDGEPVLWQPIETALTASGVPDLYGCWRGRNVWVECKRTSAWAVRTSEFQVGWLLRLARAGGSGWVAVRRRREGGPRLNAADELFLVRGASAPRLAAEGLRGRWCGWVGGGPEAWDWGVVGTTLFG